MSQPKPGPPASVLNDAYWREPFTVGHLIYVLRVYEELKAKDAAPGSENAVLYGSAEAAARTETYFERQRVSGVLAAAPGKGRIQLLCDELNNGDGLSAADVVKLRARVCRAKPCTLEEANALTLDGMADVLTQAPPADQLEEPVRTKGTPGRRGFSAEARRYALQLKAENPNWKLDRVRGECLKRFHKDDLPEAGSNFRRWLNRKRAKRAN